MSWFARNINNTGRIIRASLAVALFIGAFVTYRYTVPGAVAIAALGLFVLFEALRGWCLMRACGLKTRF